MCGYSDETGASTAQSAPAPRIPVDRLGIPWSHNPSPQGMGNTQSGRNAQTSTQRTHTRRDCAVRPLAHLYQLHTPSYESMHRTQRVNIQIATQIPAVDLASDEFSTRCESQPDKRQTPPPTKRTDKSHPLKNDARVCHAPG